MTVLLDEVFYKSSIGDIRAAYFSKFCHETNWLLVSDYSLSGTKINDVVSFTVLPLLSNLPELQAAIKQFQPADFKDCRVISPRFIELLDRLPCITISFLFRPEKFPLWGNSKDFEESMADYFELLARYVEFWRQTGGDQKRLDRLQTNIRHAQLLLARRKKLRILCEVFMISLLGGYVGSLISRETALTKLCWLSDRDRTNEVGDNLVRDLFQITLIDIIKRNISFSFTSANSRSDEWYTELTRIPDIVAGTLSGFDFSGAKSHAIKPAAQPLLESFLCGNRKNSFIYRFCVDDHDLKIQRMLVSHATLAKGIIDEDPNVR